MIYITFLFVTPSPMYEVQTCDKWDGALPKRLVTIGQARLLSTKEGLLQPLIYSMTI